MRVIRKILTSKQMVTLVWVIGLILLWEVGAAIVAQTKRTPENILPHLYQILGSVFDQHLVNGRQTAFGLVLSNAGITLLRAGIGFLIGAVIGFVLALIMDLFRPAEKVAFPYLMLIQMIPILGMAPIILAITKDINKSRIIIAAILTFYPVATNTLAGFKAVEPEKLELMHSLAASKLEVYKKLLIPFCIPYLFTGLKISAPMAITASILVDTLQGGSGLGTMLSQSLKHAMTIYVTIQLKWLPQAQFMGYYVALDKGFYTDVGLNVTIVPGGGDISETTAVNAGQVDFGVTWVSNLIAANAGGMSLIEVAQIFQRSGLVLVYKVN